MADASTPPISPGEEVSERTALLGGERVISNTSNTSSTTPTPTPGRKASTWSGDEDFLDHVWWRRPSVYWLIGPYALFTLAIGGTLVPRLNLIVSLVCRQHFADRGEENGLLAIVPGVVDPQCRTPEVQRGVAAFTLAGGVIAGVLTAFTVPRLGALSDRVGRRSVLAMAAAGGIATEVLAIVAGTNPDTIDYRWMLIAYVAEGLAGSFTAGSVAAHAYTSDCTPPSQRTVAIGYVHACLYAGVALGPLLSGYVVAWTGSLLSVFYAAMACHMVFIAYMLLVLPESLSTRRQLVARQHHADEQATRAAQYRGALDDDDAAAAAAAAAAASGHDENGGGGVRWKRVRAPLRRFSIGIRHTANPLAPLRILWPAGAHNATVRRNLVLLAMVDTTLLAVGMSMGPVVLLYSEYMFQWGNFETSAFISLVSMVRVLVLMVLFPVLNYAFRTRRQRTTRSSSSSSSPGVDAPPAPAETNTGADGLDVWLVRTAVACDVTGLLGYVVARTPALFVASGVVAACGGLGSATVQSSLTKHMPADRVGQLLGAIGLLHSVARVVAPMLFNGLYAATVGTYPQAVFILVTAVFGLVLVLAMFVRPHVYLTEDEDEPVEAPVRLSTETDEVLVDDDVVPQM